MTTLFVRLATKLDLGVVCGAVAVGNNVLGTRLKRLTRSDNGAGVKSGLTLFQASKLLRVSKLDLLNDIAGEQEGDECNDLEQF
jgi:hypothetical protein